MGKFGDLIRYYNDVRNCCAFKNHIGSEKTNIIQQIVPLQRSLSNDCKFTQSDESTFIDVYRKYRLWLLEKYLDKYYSFTEDYPKYYSSHFNHFSKKYDIPELNKRYGCENVLFFAATLNKFMSDYLNIYESSFEPEQHIDDTFITEYKMLLSTQEILRLTGVSIFDWYIESEKALIVNLQKRQLH